MRESGILLHLSSLPSPFGVGDLGPSAYQFAEFLHRSGQRIWQLLPLNPTDSAYDDSPYHSRSLFAGNPVFISPELLAQEGLLDQADLERSPRFAEGWADYEGAAAFREPLLEKAFERFEERGGSPEYDDFVAARSHWLDDYALFTALRESSPETPWRAWPSFFRDRERTNMESADGELRVRIRNTCFRQYLFFRQWDALRSFCSEKGISILGDLPIYPTYDSADVWAHPEIFRLDVRRRPLAVAGVPPDYFSDTGQLWGNPVYDWDRLREKDFAWWKMRLEEALRIYDLLRIDHFRGLVAYWEVPAGRKTAVEGAWVPAPFYELFDSLSRRVRMDSLIAEDLGTITPDVLKARRHFGIPGMKVLLFAFGDDLQKNPYLPHNHEPGCVVYTGTHDNNTARGWFEKDATAVERKNVCRYFGREITAADIAGELVRAATESDAERVILPAQDLLGLGAEARMNRPALSRGNWKWRLLPGQLDESAQERLRQITETSGRLSA